MNYLMDVVEEMAPRDTLEKMLVQQLVLSHHRAVRLSGLASAQTSLDAIRVTNESAKVGVVCPPDPK